MRNAGGETPPLQKFETLEMFTKLWYNKAKKGGAVMSDDLKLYKYHKNYSIYKSEQEWLNRYSDGAIESLQMIHGEFDKKTYKFSPSQITIQYRTGETYQWETLYINGYNMGQFGIAVTADGKMVFAQT